MTPAGAEALCHIRADNLTMAKCKNQTPFSRKAKKVSNVHCPEPVLRVQDQISQVPCHVDAPQHRAEQDSMLTSDLRSHKSQNKCFCSFSNGNIGVLAHFPSAHKLQRRQGHWEKSHFTRIIFYGAIRNTITCFREAFWITATVMVLGIV